MLLAPEKARENRHDWNHICIPRDISSLKSTTPAEFPERWSTRDATAVLGAEAGAQGPR
jgi:hypothetical protein